MGPSELLYKRSSEGEAVAAAAAALILSPFVIPKSIWIPLNPRRPRARSLSSMHVREDETPFGRENMSKQVGGVGGSGGGPVCQRV